MKMFAQTVRWFVFLALITNFSASQSYFRLEREHLTAQEGSCIEIKCIVTSRVDANVDVRDARWFWMKDGIWNNKTYDATIIFRSNTSLRSVSPEFSGRVHYIGTPSSGWNSGKSSAEKLCSVLICNLTKNDSGKYAFRFIGKGHLRWVTTSMNLTVTENPCPITFQTPQPVLEFAMIKLTCSTLSSCPSSLQITDLTGLRSTLRSEPGQGDGKTKSTTVSFKVNSQDDGKKFSCKTSDNKDPYLIQKITVTVEYGPRDTLAKISSTFIKEGDSVTLTCSANGRPAPTFTWLQNKKILSSLAEWTIPSIQLSQSGEYHCEAKNKYGPQISNPVTIDVLYAPQVEVNMTSPALVTEGDTITLICNVKRSNPKPHTYNWFVNGGNTGSYTYQYIKQVQPDDRGSYTCRATNTAGTETSQSLDIIVQYRPRKTTISTSGNTGNVEVNSLLTFFCDTDAYPAPVTYSWYRYKPEKRFDSSQWTSCKTETNQLTLNSVQRTDEACYMCNATNSIDTGEDSREFCINVLYPPTNFKLSFDDVVTEGQFITISCTVESSPLSSLTLQRTFAGATELLSSPKRDNMFNYTFTATSIHAGFYTCRAENGQGSATSAQRELRVKYRPNPVTVEALPSLTVNEGTWLKLECNAKSYPEATSFTWMKTTDWNREINKKTRTLQLESVNPSDSGRYSCAATNSIGTGRSEKVDVKVNYAPKHTKITQAAKQQQPDGRSSVELSCSSDGYPLVSEYSWYRKTKDKEKDAIVSRRQNHTVYSDEPGVYYCIAKNELNQRSSDPVELFLNRGFMTFLKFFFLALIFLLLVFVLVLVYRHRNKSAHQGRTNPQACFGFLGWWNCAKRRDLRNEPVIAEPFRSRDDLLREQPCRPQAQRRQPRPDSTPAPNINSVYCTVNLPAAQQGPSAQKPIAQRGGHTVDASVNYASVHFGNKQKKKQPKAEENVNVVYAMVSKQKPSNKNEPEKLVDYENVSAAHAAKSPHPLNYDTDTSEDDVELNYSRVSFKAKAGHQRAGRDSSSDTSSDTSSDSSTSDEEETQYSEVKL